MRTMFVFALMGILSSFAMADSTTTGVDQKEKDKEFKYECHFRDRGKGGERCKVRGTFTLEEQKGGNPRIATDRRDEEASMFVDCTDGFSLNDRRANLFFGENGRVIIEGEDKDGRHDALNDGDRERGDDDAEALLIFRLRDRDGRDSDVTASTDRDRGRDDEVRARLITFNGQTDELNGSCEIKRDRDHGHDDVSILK